METSVWRLTRIVSSEAIWEKDELKSKCKEMQRNAKNEASGSSSLP